VFEIFDSWLHALIVRDLEGSSDEDTADFVSNLQR